MDQSGPSSNVSSYDMPLMSSTSTFSSFSQQEYGQFKAQVIHQILVLQRIFQELKNLFTIEQGKTRESTNEMNAIKEQTRPMAEKMASLQKFTAKITDDNTKLKREVENQKEATKRLSDKIKEELVTLKTMLESLTKSVDETRSNMQIAGSSTSGATFAIPPNFIEVVNVLEQQMGTYDMKLAETDIRFKVLETTNYNGSIIWKIQDFRRRQEDAKRGGALSIYSQPFYTSRYGYKMCLRVYLNGDGMGRNTHVSLFFVLMKGEYDALLPFPFKQKVSLFLLDQGPNRRHLTDTFRPDPSSTSFKRPTSDMNIASGCPMFASQNTLNNSSYLVDDTIFIRAVVDTTDLENF